METVQATPPSTVRQETVASTLIFAALIFLPVAICLFRGVVDDADVWWHLKAGEWILSEGAFPSSDSFSSWGAGGPWTAYSWLPELMLVGLTRSFGLAGLIVYTAAVSAGIVAALLAMIRRLTPNPTLAVGLTLAGILGLILLETPRPWLFSILFFTIELDLLLTAGRSGNRKLLLWLIPLFALWANMHIQFVLGLVVLAAAVAESRVGRVVPPNQVDYHPRPI
jgi:hypothetical protein